jgi:CheY-like chemotaxis protein
VHVISAKDTGRRRSLRLGACNFLTKPVTVEALALALGDANTGEPRLRRLLLVEDNDVQSRAIVELIGSSDVTITAAKSGDEALRALAGERFDCMVLDLGLPDMTGFQLIDRIEADPRLEALPLIVYTGRNTTAEEREGLTLRRADVVILKDVHSMEHLLEQTALFLHRNEAKLSVPKQRMLKKVRDSDPVFAGKTVLVVDDDVRNIFAVTSVLERHKMHVLFAKDGKKGIEMLERSPAVQLVLMDVMMPEMDGYEATRAIRAIEKYATLPIVALTAKAMKDDRQKCIAAGASDYITKPVDADHLLSILRVWLY